MRLDRRDRRAQHNVRAALANLVAAVHRQLDTVETLLDIDYIQGKRINHAESRIADLERRLENLEDEVDGL